MTRLMMITWLAVQIGYAATYTFNGGNMSDAANYTPTGIPTSVDVMLVGAASASGISYAGWVSNTASQMQGNGTYYGKVLSAAGGINGVSTYYNDVYVTGYACQSATFSNLTTSCNSMVSVTINGTLTLTGAGTMMSGTVNGNVVFAAGASGYISASCTLTSMKRITIGGGNMRIQSQWPQPEAGINATSILGIP